jgi:hypothetical protein
MRIAILRDVGFLVLALWSIRARPGAASPAS